MKTTEAPAAAMATTAAATAASGPAAPGTSGRRLDTQCPQRDARSELAGLPHRGQHPIPQLDRRRGRRRLGQRGGGRPELVDLGPAVLARGQVPLERHPFEVVDCVEDVGADQGVHVAVYDAGAVAVHTATPRQSRSRTRPSRIRVFTVGSGTESRSATCR